MVDDRDSKSRGLRAVGVRVPPRPLVNDEQKETLAYIVGVALGDGNLSNPNGRAVRLRITCDARYPEIADIIAKSLKKLLPKNKVAIVRVPNVDTYFNISVYSNRLKEWMPWEVGGGSKLSQCACVPEWIKVNPRYTCACVRGLLHTDGSMYMDRGYQMVNFTNSTESLAKDVYAMLLTLGFKPTMAHTPSPSGHTKYTVRVARDVPTLIHTIGFFKR